MKNKYIIFAGVLLMAASLVNTACDNSKDIEGTLERVDLLSEITIEQTVYHTGSGSMCMLPNQEIQMNCVLGSPEALNKNYVWTSSDESVASITPMGFLVTRKAGEAVLSVTPEIGFGPAEAMPSVVLKVVDQFAYIEHISMAEEDLQKLGVEGIWEGEISQLAVTATPTDATFKRYKWKSENLDIATVDENTGLLTGVKAGETKITVTADDFSANPVSMTFTVKVNPTIPVEGIDFTDEGKSYLAVLGYGETYSMENAVDLAPAGATYTLISWSSDNESVVSIDAKTGVLKVNALTGSANITATCGDITATVPVSIAGGRLWYSFESQIAPWKATDDATLSTDGEKLKMTLDNTGDGSISFNGDLPLSMDYPILAVKMMLPYKVIPGDNKQGTIFIDTQYGRYYQSSNNGNNKFTVVEGYESQYNGNLPTTPMVCYFDLTNGFGGGDGKALHKLPESGVEEISSFKFRTVDFNKVEGHLGYTDIYWIRSFKTVDELKAYLAETESNNN